MKRYASIGAALKAVLALLFAAAVAAAPAAAQAGARAATPAQTEGPYYKSGSPERSTLRLASIAGTPLRLSGRVLDASGAPIPKARLEFWQADGAGRYDNSGYALRGHQYTDAAGRYVLETVLPGDYGSRARHIHVKILVSGAAPLTTQLYFSGESGNAADALFDARLLVTLKDVPGGKEGAFDFVLALGP